MPLLVPGKHLRLAHSTMGISKIVGIHTKKVFPKWLCVSVFFAPEPFLIFFLNYSGGIFVFENGMAEKERKNRLISDDEDRLNYIHQYLIEAHKVRERDFEREERIRTYSFTFLSGNEKWC